jgi:hypothetical protein
MILACLNGIIIPINLAFRPDELHTTNVVVFNHFVDFLFFIDIVLILMTSYLDFKTGQEVKDQKLIARKYIPTFNCLADVLSVVGSDVFTQFNTRIQVLGLFKIVRIKRISTFINQMNLPEDIKALVTFIKLIFYLIVLLNLQACVWYSVTSLNQVEKPWYPPNEWINYVDSQFFLGTKFKKYIGSFYYSAIFLGLGEIGPVNK